MRSADKLGQRAVYSSKLQPAVKVARTGSNSPTRIGRPDPIDDLWVINGTRLGIFLLTLAAVLFDKTGSLHQNSRFWVVFLGIYLIVFSLVYFENKDVRTSRFWGSWPLWIDVAVWALVFSFNSSANAVQFFGLMFAILLVATKSGFLTGVGATLMAIALMLLQMIIRGFWFEDEASSLGPFSLASVALLGTTLSYWGGTKKLDREQFALITKFCKLSNPRVGIDRILGGITHELQRFYKVDECFLVLNGNGNNDYSMYRAIQSALPDSIHAEKVDSKFGQKLLSLPPSVGAVYNEDRSPLFVKERRSPSLDVDTFQSVGLDGQEQRTIADLLDTCSYLTVPFRISSANLGRVYLLSKSRTRFAEVDIRFLSQVIESLMPGIENIRLVDRLASDAAEHERKRIALDLHDTTIQPFIGLKMGLSAIRSKLERGEGDVAADISKLIGFADAELGELRQYVTGLKGRERTSLVFRDAVHRFVEKFSDASSIKVELNIDESVKISDRLAAEVFQLIAEGLSNVRRHSESSRALVEMICRNDRLALVIENDSGVELKELASFLPRSICERSSAIGGHVEVFHGQGGVTKVHISVPL
jgi:signal transduction histidine kinase